MVGPGSIKCLTHPSNPEVRIIVNRLFLKVCCYEGICPTDMPIWESIFLQYVRTQLLKLFDGFGPFMYCTTNWIYTTLLLNMNM